MKRSPYIGNVCNERGVQHEEEETRRQRERSCVCFCSIVAVVLFALLGAREKL